MGAAAEHALATADPTDVRARSVAAHDGVIRPARRDTVFRRLLGVADILAAVGGLLVLGMFMRRGVPPVTFVAVPLIVVMAKVAGRYDHDLVLRKSTLEEVPSLIVLAAGFALAWSAVAFLIGSHLDTGRAGVVVLWGLHQRLAHHRPQLRSRDGRGSSSSGAGAGCGRRRFARQGDAGAQLRPSGTRAPA